MSGTSGDESRNVYEMGALRVDAGKWKVWYNGRRMRDLPRPLFTLLCELIKADGDVLTPEQLLDALRTPDENWNTGTIRHYIGRLRDELEAAGIPRDAIRNVSGIGYSLEEHLLWPPHPHGQDRPAQPYA
jgi:DNA-binding response OmpR family regulator